MDKELVNKDEQRNLVKMDFEEYVDSCDDIKPLLPLVHSFRAGHLDNTANVQKLTPKDCHVFKGEKLLYLYYGRTAYKSFKNNKTVRLGALFPTVFVFKSIIKGLEPVRVSATDTGALASNLYNEILSSQTKAELFTAKSTYESSSKIVNRFFKTHENYFNELPTDVENIEILHSTIVAYDYLLKYNGESAVDSRKHTIELQFDDDIYLKDNLELIIVPKSLKERTKVLFEEHENLKIETYNTGFSNPNEHISCLNRIIEEHLVENGYL